MELHKITCAGFVLYNPSNQRIVLVETPKGHFSFPKGKYEKKVDGKRSFESFFNCALRELSEETSFNNYAIQTIQPDDIEQIFVENNIIYYPAVVIGSDENSFVVENLREDEIKSVGWYNMTEISTIEPYYFKASRKQIASTFYQKFENNLFRFNNMVEVQNNIQDMEQEAFVLDKGREKYISKKLSYFLRHHLDQVPNGVDDEGFVSISSLLSMIDFNGITRQEIEYVTENNEKQRFKIVGDKIRANQGHSIESGKLIDSTKILNKLTEPKNYCIHGTMKKYIKSIMETGLNKANRTHIHFASQPNAISGYRTSSNAIIHVDMKKAMNDGIEFYISDNGVILSEGPITSDYFSKIEYIEVNPK